MILTIIAVPSVKNKTGRTNVRATTNFHIKVAAEDSQISLLVCLFSDSSEI